MNILKESSEFQSILTFSGELTVAYAAGLKTALEEAVTGSDRITLNLENVSGMDLSFLQLVYAARQNAVGLGKRLVLNSKDSELLAVTAKDAGFLPHLGAFSELRGENLQGEEQGK
jgi:anti-anti-sigma regulatory factor